MSRRQTKAKAPSIRGQNNAQPRPIVRKGAKAAKLQQRVQAYLEKVAFVMDESIRIPVINVRFGLDPVVGLVPGLGNAVGACVSFAALLQASRLKIPGILVARMIINILINTGVGAIPIIGDLFSVWFKSNRRNYRLLMDHLRYQRPIKKREYIVVYGFLFLAASFCAIAIFGVVFVFLNLLGVFR
ncbi:MAG: DUF4112 domain-containing protein [Verrucomicrobiales bacterium]